jgi:hypothetical protein
MYFLEILALNDIKILHRSHLFDALLTGASDSIEYTINRNRYQTGYYLCNGIYPPWSLLVSSIQHPQDGASKHFSQLQEALRKDIKSASRVLQACWACLKTGCCLFEKLDVMQMMNSCIILHNMIVEEQSINDPFLSAPTAGIIPNHRDPVLTHTLSNYLQANKNLHNCVTHAQL